MNKTITIYALILLLLQGCTHLSPELELGLGYGVTDDVDAGHYGELQSQPMGYIGSSIGYDRYRLGVHHLSDPTNFKDSGATWGMFTITFGGI